MKLCSEQVHPLDKWRGACFTGGVFQNIWMPGTDTAKQDESFQHTFIIQGCDMEAPLPNLEDPHGAVSGPGFDIIDAMAESRNEFEHQVCCF